MEHCLHTPSSAAIVMWGLQDGTAYAWQSLGDATPFWLSCHGVRPLSIVPALQVFNELQGNTWSSLAQLRSCIGDVDGDADNVLMEDEMRRQRGNTETGEVWKLRPASCYCCRLPMTCSRGCVIVLQPPVACCQ